MLEGAADGGAVRRLDAIAKDVVAHTPVIAAPRDDARPGERAPEGAGPKRPPPFRPGDFLRDDSRERPQESPKCLARAGAHEQVQV